MRKLLLSSLAIVALVGLILSLNVTWATSLQLSSSPAAFLPHIAKEGTATATGTPPPPPPTAPPPSLTPLLTAPPLNQIAIVELSGHSDPEYLDIYNGGAIPQDMTGWYIVSVIGGETFYFPDGYVLGSASLVQVESGQAAVNNPPLQLLWASETIWNNSGDKALLYTNTNVVVSSACYGIGCAQH